MVSVLASSAVNRGFEPRSGLTKDYTIAVIYIHVRNEYLYIVLTNKAYGLC
jgi:hypothetical protein